MIAGLTRGFESDVVVGARAHGVLEVEERESAGEGGDPGAVGEELAPQSRGDVVPEHVADRLQVRHDGRHQDRGRGGVVEALVLAGELVQAQDDLRSGLGAAGLVSGSAEPDGRGEAYQLEQHAAAHDLFSPGVEHP
jgi:hypothetical protein